MASRKVAVWLCYLFVNEVKHCQNSLGHLYSVHDLNQLQHGKAAVVEPRMSTNAELTNSPRPKSATAVAGKRLQTQHAESKFSVHLPFASLCFPTMASSQTCVLGVDRQHLIRAVLPLPR